MRIEIAPAKALSTKPARMSAEAFLLWDVGKSGVALHWPLAQAVAFFLIPQQSSRESSLTGGIVEKGVAGSCLANPLPLWIPFAWRYIMYSAFRRQGKISCALLQ